MRSTKGVGMFAGTGVTRKKKEKMVICCAGSAVVGVARSASWERIAAALVVLENEKRTLFSFVASAYIRRRSWLFMPMFHKLSERRQPRAGQLSAYFARIDPPAANTLLLVFLWDLKRKRPAMYHPAQFNTLLSSPSYSRQRCSSTSALDRSCFQKGRGWFAERLVEVTLGK